MLKFKDFLSEEHDAGPVHIEVDDHYLENNVEALNNDFDRLTEKPYQNAPIFLNQLRGTLERYGMMIPAGSTKHFLNLEAELVFTLGKADRFLYVVYNTNDDGYVDGYAQVVDREELNDLMEMDVDDLVNSERDAIKMRASTWYAKRDDDAGNSDEY
jgi:hypothetical protein